MFEAVVKYLSLPYCEWPASFDFLQKVNNRQELPGLR